MENWFRGLLHDVLISQFFSNLSPGNVIFEVMFSQVSFPEAGEITPDVETFASGFSRFLEFRDEPADESVAQSDPSIQEGVGKPQPFLNLSRATLPFLGGVVIT